jgi:ABC-type spermidine/putrescine transport system permease subunit II
MTTVTSSANNSSVSTHAPTLHKGEDSSSSSSSTWVEMTMEEKNHRAVWVTLIVCLNVVLFTVIALCVRTSYACYQKLKKAQALAEASKLFCIIQYI